MTRVLFIGLMPVAAVVSESAEHHWLEDALMLDDLRLLGARILLLFAVVLVAIVIDLIRGVQRAIRLGIARRSKGYRATIVKVNEYFSFLSLFALIDVVVLLSGVLHTLGVSGAPIFPLATACACFYPLYVEVRSVREKMTACRKRDLNDSIEGFRRLIRGATAEDKSELVDAIKTILTDENHDSR